MIFPGGENGISRKFWACDEIVVDYYAFDYKKNSRDFFFNALKTFDFSRTKTFDYSRRQPSTSKSKKTFDYLSSLF